MYGLHCVYIPYLQILSVPDLREHHGYDSVIVLTLLINYRKYEVYSPVFLAYMYVQCTKEDFSVCDLQKKNVT